MEMYEGFNFTVNTGRCILNTVIKKFEDLCLGETNETYERFVFQDNETIAQYVATRRSTAKARADVQFLHLSMILSSETA